MVVLQVVFEFDNSISGSATSTGSFNRLNFNSLSVTDVSGVTGHEAGHGLQIPRTIAAGISASFQGGFAFGGTISALLILPLEYNHLIWVELLLLNQLI